jgi:hypothetical protein
MLQSIYEVQQMIAAGKSLILAGSAPALSQLPAGNWIGGSIPYFMDKEGGVNSESRIFVTEVPARATGVEIRAYSAEDLSRLYSDAPANGFSFLLVPNGAPFLAAFASHAQDCEGFLLKPIVGWVTGVDVSALGKEAATVVDGRSQTSSSEWALAMHVALPASQVAELEIVNIFKPGCGDTLSFSEAGFAAGDCLINDRPANLAQYIGRKGIDTRLPLTADYCGSIINVSLQAVEAGSDTVRFYAPVFPGVKYRFAEPVPDYAAAFAKALPHGDDSLFSCNCILNYLYGGLEGKHTGSVYGPVTFGEIAHLLLNQTLVQLKIHDAG